MSLTHPAARIAFGSRGSCVRAFPRHSKALWLSPCCRWSNPTVVRSSGLSGENSSASCKSLSSSYRQYQGTNRKNKQTQDVYCSHLHSMTGATAHRSPVGGKYRGSAKTVFVQREAAASRGTTVRFPRRCQIHGGNVLSMASC